MAHSSRKRPAIALLAIAGLALTGVGGPAADAAPLAGNPVPAGKTASTGKDIQVTLITGDRVVLHGGDPTKQSIERGAGREHIAFQAFRAKDHSYVIPSDVTKAVGDGRLDQRLFDVAGLIRAGYDDASTTVIPVLATYARKANHAAPAGVTVTRQLPSINGASMAVDKKNASAFLGKAAARSADGFSRIWLDGKRKVTLDQSVPQIGGPAAWQAGYTGKGVSVAVLDTGIDKSHPDLATQVAGSKNFTAEQDGDFSGHGTHVASTIAGTGAASGGKYKGVAPDAKLYDGKVCDGTGFCTDSGIVAAMEWAAKDIKANVVNVSLGGTDTPDIDPLEEAVNRLTAETGALFVIAAGNSGPADRTIESPGSADAALTVGAVDKQNEFALFSSVGPRSGDSALKPDVTAPGLGIVAAKAKDSRIGTPVGDQYLDLSGTSMATPHTAGAAALLSQEHPAWQAGELKSTLMGSAKVAADQSVMQQGAGRIDVAAAIKQNVIAETASLSFGLAAYPHTDDEPVVKPLTFRNLGAAAVTLALTASFAAKDGTPAPDSALQLSARTVTVPAGGTASVQVTSNTKHDGSDSVYSGRITATGAGPEIVVPITAEKEPESYTLTVRTINPAGEPSDFPVNIIDVDHPESNLRATDGTLKVKLPKGEYVVEHFLEDERAADDWAIYEMVAPSVKLTSDRTVVLDARKARPVTHTLPEAEASPIETVGGYTRRPATGGGSGFASYRTVFRRGALYTLGTGPALPAAQLTGWLTSQWAKENEDGLFWNTPYVYQLAKTMPGVFPTGYQRVVRARDLAVVNPTVNPTSGTAIWRSAWPQIPGTDLPAPGIRFDVGRTVRYHYDELSEGWTGAVDADDASWGQDSVLPEVYRAGRTYEERWNAAAFGPRLFHAARTGARMVLLIGNHGDAAGHIGHAVADSAKVTLYRDGEQVASGDSFGYLDVDNLPAGEAPYKLVTSSTQSGTGFASRVELTATFTSAPTTKETALPISTVRFQPKVDDHNLATRTKVTALPVLVDGLKPSQVKTLTVEVSGDDGATWKAAKVRRTAKGFTATFDTPAGTGISLRASVTDRAGNNTTQTVHNTYRLK
ncbi:S8 family serine peptidase [Kribbella sp. NBC_01505]|uniref:S8 family serine peptidase n=1 Tax=Kribbella sp. NBC_01505 TaxID=2903580 RepID=UPI0038649787